MPKSQSISLKGYQEETFYCIICKRSVLWLMAHSTRPIKGMNVQCSNMPFWIESIHIKYVKCTVANHTGATCGPSLLIAKASFGWHRHARWTAMTLSVDVQYTVNNNGLTVNRPSVASMHAARRSYGSINHHFQRRGLTCEEFWLTQSPDVWSRRVSFPRWIVDRLTRL